MTILLLLITFSLFQFGSCFTLAKNLITISGGAAVDITNVPYQVSVVVNGMHLCGGSIISPKYVVTAAHCIDGESADTTFIDAGSSTLNFNGNDGVRSEVAEIHEHPQFSFWNYDYDIAILKLRQELNLSDKINIVHLPESSEDVPNPGTSATVSGWGATSERSSNFSTALMSTTVQIYSLYECLNFYSQDDFTQRMICAGSPDGKNDACYGDSGGPLAVNDVLYGIVSWGYACGEENHPGVYTSVIPMREFIANITGL